MRRAKPSVPNRTIGKRGLLDLFRKLEEIAGVASVPGRGWYGIRRHATDVYEDYEADERVLNDQTGHRSSETRREVYQEKEREETRAKSARTRRRVRESAFGRKVEPPAGGNADVQTSLDLPEEEAEKGSSYPTAYPRISAHGMPPHTKEPPLWNAAEEEEEQLESRQAEIRNREPLGVSLALVRILPSRLRNF